MEQINAKITITNQNEKQETKTKINITNDKIWYIENDVYRTLSIYNLKEDTLERDNEELYLKYKFIKDKYTKNLLEIKSLNKKTNIEIFTKNIYKTNNFVKITYIIDDCEFIYEIKY